jgi:hypothetical protein
MQNDESRASPWFQSESLGLKSEMEEAPCMQVRGLQETCEE